MPGIVDGAPIHLYIDSHLGLHADYLKGTLWVDEFVTHHQKLDDINKGFDDMHVSPSPYGVTALPALHSDSPRR